MIRSQLIIFIFILLSPVVNAQQLQDPIPLTQEQIQKDKWVLQNTTKNIIVQWTPTTLEITLDQKPINQNQQKTVYASLPISILQEGNDEYVLLTKTTSFNSTFNEANWTQEELEFFRTIENSAITLEGEDNRLYIKKGQEAKYELYSSSFDRMCKFISRFDWGLIALNRVSDKLPKMIVSLDFQNNTMTGSIDQVPFRVDFKVYYDQNLFSFESFELIDAKKNKTSRKIKDKYGKYFTSTVYHYDIAEQTLNFYRDNKLILMFGFMPKQ